MTTHLTIEDLDPTFDEYEHQATTDTDAARLMRAHRLAVADLERSQALWATEEQRIADSKQTALDPLRNRIEMLAANLEGWGRLQMRQAEAAGHKPAKSWKLPDGTLSSRATQARIEVENKDIVSAEFLVETVKLAPDTAKVKALVETGVLAADEHGTMRHTQTGEVITGLAYQPAARNFSIKETK